MMHFSEAPVSLHREAVDFRKAINGLSLIVETAMAHSIFAGGLFVFCNKRRDKLKILYWPQSGELHERVRGINSSLIIYVQLSDFGA